MLSDKYSKLVFDFASLFFNLLSRSFINYIYQINFEDINNSKLINIDIHA